MVAVASLRPPPPPSGLDDDEDGGGDGAAGGEAAGADSLVGEIVGLAPCTLALLEKQWLLLLLPLPLASNPCRAAGQPSLAAAALKSCRSLLPAYTQRHALT